MERFTYKLGIRAVFMAAERPSSKFCNYRGSLAARIKAGDERV